MTSNDYLKEAIKGYLINAQDYEWTLQGFGMLRLHMTDEFRLNIWDSRFRVPDVSLVHTHPWNFESVIVAGQLNNIIFEEVEEVEEEFWSGKYSRAPIKPGIGGGIFPEDITTVNLKVVSNTEHIEGEVYSQTADMIHLSNPSDGSVTMNRRQRIGDDRAFVYWSGEQFVSAEPRVATQDEIVRIINQSLDLWF